MATKSKKASSERSKYAKLVAGLKASLSKKQDELDKAGIERKALSPELVDGLRDGLVEIVPDIDEEATTAIMQMIVDVLAEELPESDVEEEMDMDDKEDEDEKADGDEEDEKQVAKLTEQVTEMAKDMNNLIKDMSEVVQLSIKSAERSNADTKEFNDISGRVAVLEKAYKQKPRRASQAAETQLDPDSKIAKDLAAQAIADSLPPAFADMAPKGSA